MLIKCPECGKEISNKSKQCIHCGFPLNELSKNNNNKELSDSKCPMCGVQKMHVIKDNIKETCAICGYVFNEEYVQNNQELLPQLKCPTCQSTNIRKISGTKNAVSIIGFGILSNNIGKTFECLNCKYKW